MTPDPNPAEQPEPELPPAADVSLPPDDLAYLGVELREAIATAPSIHEQGIVIDVSADRVLLSGSVAAPAQREAVGQLVQRLVPDRQVINHVVVPSVTPPTEVEEI